MFESGVSYSKCLDVVHADLVPEQVEECILEHAAMAIARDVL